MNTNHITRLASLALAALLVAVGGVGLWVVNHGAQAADEKDAKDGRKPAATAVVVTTAAVRAQDVAVYREGIGTVTPTFSVTVRPRIDGQLDTVGFTEGQDVRKGQVLAVIDPRTLRAQLLQAQAARARDAAALANARADLQRFTTLVAQDAATAQQLDTQKSLVAQLEAAVATDDAQVNVAKVQLDFTTITAPIGGRVGARLVDPGNIVHAADATGLVVINQIDPISVVFTLPEGAVQDINRAVARTHRPLLAQAYPRDGKELLAEGTLTLVNNQIDTATGTVQLKASFPNPQHALWPGQYVNMRLVLGTRPGALTIPEAAVQRSQAGTFAYVLGPDGKTALSQPISLARVQDGTAVVERGLEAGQRVVVDGQYKLKPGSHVVEAARRASAPASAVVAAN